MKSVFRCEDLIKTRTFDSEFSLSSECRDRLTDEEALVPELGDSQYRVEGIATQVVEVSVQYHLASS